MGAATDPGQREQRWLEGWRRHGDDEACGSSARAVAVWDDRLVLQAITGLQVEMLRAERCPDPAAEHQNALLAGVGHGVVQRFLDRIDSHLDQLEILPHSADKLISRVAPRQAEDGALLSANQHPLGLAGFPKQLEESCLVKRRENSDRRQRWRDDAALELAQHARAHLGFLRDIGQAQASLLSQRAKAAAKRDQRPIEVRFGLSSRSLRVLLSDRAILEQRHEGIFAAALDSGLGDPVASAQ
jgi:hypothetical protein